ncbi:hypothetical protein [Marinoscillum sp.]|uniref:hypothetical protein n=1 Tax=Marinoscillum sp. TaxID=2024838 RepID=UPI003BAB1796
MFVSESIKLTSSEIHFLSESGNSVQIPFEQIQYTQFKKESYSKNPIISVILGVIALIYTNHYISIRDFVWPRLGTDNPKPALILLILYLIATLFGASLIYIGIRKYWVLRIVLNDNHQETIGLKHVKQSELHELLDIMRQNVSQVKI